MRKQLLAVVLLMQFSLSSPAVAQTSAPMLVSPFVGHVHHFATIAVAAPSPCKAVPPVVRDEIGVSYYTDANHSIIDPTLQAQNNANLQPGRDYLKALVALVDAAALDGDANSGACALVWLQSWAQGGALEGTVNRQGAFEDKWLLTGIALSYLKLRETGLVAPSAAGPIATWLEGATDRIRTDYDTSTDSYAKNNHAYWAGLLLAAVGIAANDRDRFNWGLSKYRMGINDVTADGILPNEMERKDRALHYHCFALDALVLLAEIGEVNGIDLYSEGNGALHRVVKRTVAGLQDPQSFAALAGATQDIKFPLAPDEAAWMEVYQSRFPLPAIDAILSPQRPIIYDRNGGNMTQTFLVKRT
jgi:poly(beta-D-mannuronate) lyase